MKSRNKQEGRMTITVTLFKADGTIAKKVVTKPKHTRRAGKTYRKIDLIGSNSIEWTHNRVTRKRLHMAYPDNMPNARQPKHECNCSEC